MIQKEKKKLILSNIYFQKQGSYSLQCGKCSINNLLGGEFVTKKKLDQICYQLSSALINPHKHIMGGEYDANVILRALNGLGYNYVWLDYRNPIKLDQLQYKYSTIGFLINQIQQKNWCNKIFGLEGRHWLVIKKSEQGQFFVLDSKYQMPMQVMNVKETEQKLRQYQEKKSEIIQIYNQQSRILKNQ